MTDLVHADGTRQEIRQAAPEPEPKTVENIGKPDHDILATELAELWREQYAYFHGQWHEYSAGVWKTRSKEQIRMKIRLHLREQRKRGISITDNLVTGVMKMLGDELNISDDELIERGKQSKIYINLQNGLFNLKTFRLEPHRPDLYSTIQMSFAYDPKADCPNFRNFLKTSLILPDTRQEDLSLIYLVLEAIGYSLTGTTDLKASFWLFGESNSGKSTLLKVIRALAGDFHGPLDLNNIASSRFLLSSVVGKRVMTCTEADTDVRLPDGLYKALTGGGDEIQVDIKNRDPIKIVVEAVFWWAMNNMPQTIDRTPAIFNRIHIIPFNREFQKNEQISGLDELLYGELPGIFNLVMSAYRRLRKRQKEESKDFTVCEQSVAAKEDYRLRNDTEGLFVRECYEWSKDSFVKSNDLYLHYVDWCKERGFRPKSITNMAKEWMRLKLQRVERPTGTYWYGIKRRTL
jgi:putative DNA primase/helicase